MPRSPLLALTIVIVALLAPAAAPAAGPEEGTIVTVDLELEASNGLEAQLETSENGTVTLELRRKDSLVSYEVKGEVTERGLKVRFGRLGLIDVVFTPTKVLDSTEPSEGCGGEPRTLREGVFTGTIDFTGERKYTRIEATQAEGSMSVISQWHCLDEPPTPFAGALRANGTGEQKGEKSASLHVFSRRCLCAFYAGVYYAKGRGRSIFYALQGERREGMEIIRSTTARGGGSAFVFDHEAGTATVRPPLPFKGQATFRRRPGEPGLWRGKIRMPFLGAGPLSPRGPDVRASLYPEYHFD
jgi:hypothetical protein